MKIWASITLLCFLWCSQAKGADVYRVKRSGSFISTTAQFCYDILEQALASTYQNPNDFKIEYAVIDGDEFTRLLMRNEPYTDMVDITYTVARAHWEKQLHVVRVPLLKGYMGYRINLIHQDNINAFAQIEQLKQLKPLYLGSGKGWATTAIHQKYGFNTVEAPNVVALIKLLMNKRIDYFSRGLTEILGEYRRFKPIYQGLAIEPNLMVYIPAPYYFFVNPHKPLLAKRLHRGLLKIIKNGTYQKIFDQYFSDVIEELNVNKRKVFTIDNPNISQEALENLQTFWAQQVIEP